MDTGHELTGSLVYGEVRGVEDPDRLEDGAAVVLAIRAGCAQGRATICREWVYHFVPQGMTVVAVLAESHVVVSTYPERAAYALDIYTCGRTADPMAIASGIITSLGGGQPQLRQVTRGRDGQVRTTDVADG